MTSAQVIAAHRAAGREFTAAGVRSFVREEGRGEPVLCIHGVPASSFVYRKVLHEVAAQGLRGVAFDLPGLGLAERPAGFDYTWTGFGRWCAAAVDALDLQRFHLLVHDFGGPVGFELCARFPERILSLTILNTVIEVDRFRRPWALELMVRPGLGELSLRAMRGPLFRLLLVKLGIHDRRAISRAELDAWGDLVRREDGGRALLEMVRRFERTRAKRDLYVDAVHRVGGPVQIVWGMHDPVLRIDVHGEQMRAATGAPLHRVDAKHFLQEDRPAELAHHVARLAAVVR